MKKKFILAILIFVAPVTIITEGYTEGNTTEGAIAHADSADLTVILDELSWLTGRWEGEAFGGRCEEIWSQPSAGSMVGLFKVWKGDKVSFYEIETITVDTSGLSFNVKHFNADLTGWEDKEEVVRFPFISAGKEEIKFKGITYRKISSDSLQILLDTRDSDGNVHEIEINLKRAKK